LRFTWLSFCLSKLSVHKQLTNKQKRNYEKNYFIAYFSRFAQTAKQPLKEPGLIVVRNDTGTKLSQERVKDYLDMDSRALAIANAMRSLAKNNDIKAEVLKLSKATGQEIFFTLRSVDSDGDYHFSVRGYTASEKEALFKGIDATHVVYIQNYVFEYSVVSENSRPFLFS
jgi:hypothetical protein